MKERFVNLVLLKFKFDWQIVFTSAHTPFLKRTKRSEREREKSHNCLDRFNDMISRDSSNGTHIDGDAHLSTQAQSFQSNQLNWKWTNKQINKRMNDRQTENFYICSAFGQLFIDFLFYSTCCMAGWVWVWKKPRIIELIDNFVRDSTNIFHNSKSIRKKLNRTKYKSAHHSSFRKQFIFNSIQLCS